MQTPQTRAAASIHHCRFVAASPILCPKATRMRRAAVGTAGAPLAPVGDAPTCAVWWVRAGDMRLADNPALLAAAAPHVRYLLPVFCLDPAELQPRRRGGGGGDGGAGVPIMGPHRARCAPRAQCEGVVCLVACCTDGRRLAIAGRAASPVGLRCPRPPCSSACHDSGCGQCPSPAPPVNHLLAWC